MLDLDGEPTLGPGRRQGTQGGLIRIRDYGIGLLLVARCSAPHIPRETKATCQIVPPTPGNGAELSHQHLPHGCVRKLQPVEGRSRWFLAALADSVLGFFQWERERAAQVRHKDLWSVICGARPAPSTRSNIYYVVRLSTRVYYVVEGFFTRRQGH